MGSPRHPHTSASSKALAVGLGFGVAAVAGVAVGVLFSANALTIAAATRQRAKPALCEADLEEDAEGRILNWRSALRVIQQRVRRVVGSLMIFWSILQVLALKNGGLCLCDGVVFPPRASRPACVSVCGPSCWACSPPWAPRPSARRS